MRKKEQEHLIQTVYPGSIAEELEIEPGDVLLKINGQKIEDVFDPQAFRGRMAFGNR